jgi:septal ring factor EnvC (AmiA/AmiB activator)
MFLRVMMILCLLLAGYLLPAQSGNEKELQDLRSRIEKERKAIEQVRKNKSQAVRNRENLRKRLSDNTRRLAELQRLEESAGLGISSVQDSLKSADRHVDDLNRVANDLFLRLFQLDNQRRINRESRADRFMIASLLASATGDLQAQDAVRSGLSEQLSAQRQTIQLAQWQRMTTTENGKKYKSRIDELGRTISDYETREASHQAKIRELEQNARDLEELIAKLKTKPAPEPVTKVSPRAEGKMTWPARGRIARGYGEYRDPEYKTVSNNKGIDITLPPGSAIHATDRGVVVYAEWFESLGKVIIVDHGDGLRSVYSHVERLMVTKGDIVTKGQQIGAGSTERSSELHFEIRRGNQPVNPMNYLE